jgi:thiamine-phosphate pyrophosphorylase
VHLNSNALMSCKFRPAPKSILLSAACHNAAQISHAESMGADFVTLSPVLPTKTHPEAAPMGWESFGEIVSGSKIPVFALGGMRPELIGTAKEYGAWGVAAISSTWYGSSSVE